jgi:2-polyprenyl-6-hydroxyphenyl methylase/3-demethylubiquinone-9 3-methyltransferase
MPGYYENILSARKLERVYALAPPRIRQYLDAEVRYVLGHIPQRSSVLELGCGYGRILPRLAGRSRMLVGIDTSQASLRRGRKIIGNPVNIPLARMDAVRLGFADGVFDAVVGIQNAISAFHVDRRELLAESVRVAKPGGRILFSSYTEKIWPARLEWFRLQARAGLLGEIDEEQTENGRIVCKDGFTASTVGPEEFRSLTASLGDVDVSIEDVDGSSLFCVIVKRA